MNLTKAQVEAWAADENAATLARMTESLANLRAELDNLQAIGAFSDPVRKFLQMIQSAEVFRGQIEQQVAAVRAAPADGFDQAAE